MALMKGGKGENAPGQKIFTNVDFMCLKSEYHQRAFSTEKSAQFKKTHRSVRGEKVFFCT